MRKLRHSMLFRRASYWLLGLALFTIAVYAVQRTVLLRSQQRRNETRRARQELTRMVDLWEGHIVDRVGSWIADLAVVEDVAARERQLRQTVPWFNGLYVWEPVGTTGGAPSIVHPPAVHDEDLDALLADDCMREAHGLAVTGRHRKAARRFLKCARSTAPPIGGDGGISVEERALLASSMAASLLVSEGSALEAWEALSTTQPPLQYPLYRANGHGLPVKRLVTRRLQAADALEALGRDQQRKNLEELTAREITELSGPELRLLLPTAERLFAREFPEDPALAGRLSRARQRSDGYTEVVQRLSRRPGVVPTQDAEDTEEPPGLEVVHVSAPEGGYLLIYGPVAELGQAAAVQVEVDELITALIESTPRDEPQPDLVILDSKGEALRGGPIGDEGPMVWVEVPFRRLVPHFRLGMLERESETARNQFWWVLSQLAPIAIALLLGFIAVAGRMGADRQQAELYERQQAFIARITHELKTPLAGIRVLAETLDLVGLTEKSEAFPRRIVREVERLDQRITEVLAVARKPEVSERTPISPHQLAADLAQHWRTRFEGAGARLETDLKDCQAIAADPALLRDALNNLLDNALKYLREDRPGIVRVRTGEVGRWVIFEVTDNGIGVPAAMRKKIFERFTRVEGAGRGKAGGYGLGLSFVAEAAAAHGGLVECLEGIDGGARFRLKLRRR